MLETIQYTVKVGTLTSEGVIPHRRHPAGFDMPVALNIIKSYKNGGRIPIAEPQAPLRDSRGRLVWALPGGGRYVD